MHSDVGGGYSEPELAEIPLLWMVDRARAAGLAFDPDRLQLTPPDDLDPELRVSGVQVAPDALGKIHNSLKGFYLLLSRHRRPLVADGGSLASSAARRRREASDYAPRNLVDYLASGGPETAVEDGGQVV